MDMMSLAASQSSQAGEKSLLGKLPFQELFAKSTVQFFSFKPGFWQQEGHRGGSCGKLLEASHHVQQSQWLMALKMDLLLTKTGLMKEVGKASVMTYLRRKSKQSHRFLLLIREEEEVKTCEGKQYGNTKVSGEERGGVPGGGAKIPLQAMMKTMVKQLCPCSPWGSMGDAEIHPQPMGIHEGCRDPPTALGEVPKPEWMDAWRRL
ncbi:hypothetical protein HGM15179_015719 [Zosterops borbonicus]|uniref:Uncharacterized protein n=1 Tax=Zosterops borbonicus TaxID=364589 RepID=A0A8K1G4K5_9PASS|nr:hypothetical protein HGM15179_015719 [Zosterops borbonicus]